MERTPSIRSQRIKHVERDLVAQREFMRNHLPIAQRFGASVMNSIGHGFEGLIGSNEPSAIRINAYREGRKPSVTRRIWAGLATTALLTGAYEVAAVVDTNYLSCEGAQAVTLQTGSNLETLAKTIPHHNTPLTVVEDAIAGANSNMVDLYSGGLPNLNSAQPGEYVVPVNCDATLRPIVPIGG